MTDEAKALVERLEEWEWTLRAAYKGGDLGTDEPALLMGEAADLIETQAREIERLRGALEQIAQADYGYTDIIESGAPPEKHADYFCSMVTWRQRTARAALAGDSHDQ